MDDYEKGISEFDPEIRSDISTSFGLYRTPEKALEDIYDSYSSVIGELEDQKYDDFIEDRIQSRIVSLENAPREGEESIRYSLKALDDEASWLLSRYPQFVGGTLLGVGGAAYSAAVGDVSTGSALSMIGGSSMTYTAFNGTSETMDKILTFRDEIPEQEEIWKEALEEHRLNGFSSREVAPNEVNHRMLHPFVSKHNMAYKKDGEWEEVEFAESMQDLRDKRGDNEIAKLITFNLRDIAPEYISQMGSNAGSALKNKFKP
jgi:hypothetical protein